MKKNHLKKILALLRHIEKLRCHDLSEFIDMLNDDHVDNICECVYNVMYTDMKMGKHRKIKLKRHIIKNCSKKRIQLIANKNVPLFKRKKALKQEGRGLGLILASVIPFLTSLFTK